MSKLAGRVAEVSEELLRRKKVVAPLEVLLGLGWLSRRTIQAWEQGQADHVDQLAAVPTARITEAMTLLTVWATGRGLLGSEVDYVSATRDRRPLRFTVDGDERTYRTHWTDPASPMKAPKVPDLVVLLAEKNWYCAQCAETGDLYVVEDEVTLCLDCVDLGHLSFLPSGDAALTRRARKASGLAAVVMRWNKGRKRFERRGILVEHGALRTAEEQCLADEDIRERRKARDRDRRAVQDVEFQGAFADRIADLFP
ncbi:MAG: DUF2293 domain-containing protein, partial [Actinomycetota bacterium]|nr:DUF2293 domain-containing protein [Actinomycetota bacterium]